MDVAGEQGGDHFGGAFVGNMLHRQPGLAIEHLGGEVKGVADAGRSIENAVGPRRDGLRPCGPIRPVRCRPRSRRSPAPDDLDTAGLALSPESDRQRSGLSGGGCGANGTWNPSAVTATQWML